MRKARSEERRETVYAEVTRRVIAELEEGRLPWVQPWDMPPAAVPCPPTP